MKDNWVYGTQQMQGFQSIIGARSVQRPAHNECRKCFKDESKEPKWKWYLDNMKEEKAKAAQRNRIAERGISETNKVA